MVEKTRGASLRQIFLIRPIPYETELRHLPLPARPDVRFSLVELLPLGATASQAGTEDPRSLLIPYVLLHFCDSARID